MKQTTRRRTEISIETHEVRTLRMRRQDTAICPHCGAETMIVVESTGASLAETELSAGMQIKKPTV